jgi:uncharacterized membrane protein
MSVSDQRPTPADPLTMLGPQTSGEYVTFLAHYYRGELSRMAGWRDRIDLTSNWAITVAGAMLSISLSTATAHHGVVVFAMLLVLLLLVIEARRYRFFDVYRARVRGLERNWYAPVFAPELELKADWLSAMAEDLRRPAFRISRQQALSRRLRRNYGWLFLVLLLAWLLKTSSAQDPSGGVRLARSLGEWISQCQIGPIPGLVVLTALGIFYAWLTYVGISFRNEEVHNRELYGDVYV